MKDCFKKKIMNHEHKCESKTCNRCYLNKFLFLKLSKKAYENIFISD